MSSNSRENYHSQPPPIYTVSGAYPGNVNYGFHSAPPPKYEDAVRGTPMEQPPPAHEELQPTGVILVSPVYTDQKDGTSKWAIIILCLLLYFIFFLSVLILT